MGITADTLAKEAMTLPYPERARLVDRLLATLEPEIDDDLETAWFTEIERRAAEIDRGEVSLIGWEEVRKRALRRVDGRD